MDGLDSYLLRFEKYAQVHVLVLPEDIWALINLSALLSRKALQVFTTLSVERTMQRYARPCASATISQIQRRLPEEISQCSAREGRK